MSLFIIWPYHIIFLCGIPTIILQRPVCISWYYIFDIKSVKIPLLAQLALTTVFGLFVPACVLINTFLPLPNTDTGSCGKQGSLKGQGGDQAA